MLCLLEGGGAWLMASIRVWGSGDNAGSSLRFTIAISAGASTPRRPGGELTGDSSCSRVSGHYRCAHRQMHRQTQPEWTESRAVMTVLFSISIAPSYSRASCPNRTTPVEGSYLRLCVCVREAVSTSTLVRDRVSWRTAARIWPQLSVGTLIWNTYGI